MFFKLGIKNLKYDFFMNILIILQMAFAFVITISMISTIVSRFSYYTPIKTQLDRPGYFYYISYGLNPDTGYTLRENSELSSLLEGENEVLGAYSVWITYPDSDANFISYDAGLIDTYSPELTEGNWADMSKTKSNLIPIAVCGGNFKKGERVTFDIFGSEEKIETEVVAVLKEGSKVFNCSPAQGNGRKYDCRSAYVNYYYQIEEKPLFIFNQQSLLAENRPVTVQLNGPLFVTYKQNTSPEIIENGNNIVKKMNVIYSVPTDEMKKNSMEYIFSQIYTLFPILVCILILTIIGAISVNALSTKRQLRNYAVYYICGLKWKECAKINMISSIICMAISFAISILAVCILQNTNILGGNLIKIGLFQIIGCIVLIFIYILLSSILPIRIIKNNTPNQILKAN